MNELARSVLGVLILRLSLPLDGLTAGPQKAPRSPRTGERRLMKARGKGWAKEPDAGSLFAALNTGAIRSER